MREGGREPWRLSRRALAENKVIGMVPGGKGTAPLKGTMWPSRPPTAEPRSAHISLFQEPDAQTLSLPLLPKRICFTFSQEGSLELLPGQCLGGKGGRRSPETQSCSGHTKCPLYCRTQTCLSKMTMLGQGMWGRGDSSMPRNENTFHRHILARTLTHTSSTESNERSLRAGSYYFPCLAGI